jgi:hypothetical protein
VASSGVGLGSAGGLSELSEISMLISAEWRHVSSFCLSKPKWKQN